MLSLILAGTAIAIASLYPSLQLPGIGEGFDLGFHGAAYGVLVILGVILGGILWRRLHWVAVVLLLYSTLLAGLQEIVPGRESHLSDLAANALGILAGLAIVALWRSQQGVPEPNDKDR